MKKLVKWGVLAVVVLIVISAIASAGGDKDKGSTATTAADAEPVASTEASKTETTEKPKGDPTVGLKTEIKVGNVGWTALAIKTTDKLHVDNQFIEDKTTSGKFLWVDLKIKNLGKEPITADSSAMAVKDDQDREFKAYTEAFSYIPDNKQLFLKAINPGMDVQGTVIFEVPADAKGLKLSVGDLKVFGNDQGLIDLGM